MLSKVETTEDSVLKIISAMKRYGSVLFTYDTPRLCAHFHVIMEDDKEYEFDVSMYDLLNSVSTSLVIDHHSKILDDMKKEG